MSQFLVYEKNGKCFIAYRDTDIYGIGISNTMTLYETSISLEQKERKNREKSENSRMADIMMQQTRDREERAREISDIQNSVVERFERERKDKREEDVDKPEANMFTKTLESQRKAKEEELITKEKERREEKRKLKELEEKLEKEKARQKELERKGKQEQFTGKEQELLESIEETEKAISRLKSEMDAKTKLADKNSQDTLRLLETLRATQESILQKEQENLEWKQRCEQSERLRRKTEESCNRERKEREKEEAEMRLAELESALKIADGGLMRKWRQEEFKEIGKKITSVRSDFKNGNFGTVRLSASELHRKLEILVEEALSDEKIECQREYVATSFLEALGYLSYEVDMRQEDPNDPRSAVLINAKRPSGIAIDITIPFGKVYRIKFSGVNEEKQCCSQETALRETMEKFGVSSMALEPLGHSGIPHGKTGMKLQFKDGKKKIDLRPQFCG